MNGRAARLLRRDGTASRKAKRMYARLSAEQKRRRREWIEGGREAAAKLLAQKGPK